MQKRQKDACALVEELVSKFYWLYKFKDKDTQEIIRQQARLLHDNDVETVVGDVATIALHHLLFNTPDGYMTTEDKCDKLRAITKFKKVSDA